MSRYRVEIHMIDGQVITSDLVDVIEVDVDETLFVQTIETNITFNDLVGEVRAMKIVLIDKESGLMAGMRMFPKPLMCGKNDKLCLTWTTNIRQAAKVHR